MILTTMHSKFSEISPPIEKYNLKIDKMDFRKKIVNLYLSFVQINILNKPPLPDQNSGLGTTLFLLLPVFIIRSFNILSIYYKKNSKYRCFNICLIKI